MEFCVGASGANTKAKTAFLNGKGWYAPMTLAFLPAVLPSPGEVLFPAGRGFESDSISPARTSQAAVPSPGSPCAFRGADSALSGEGGVARRRFTP